MKERLCLPRRDGLRCRLDNDEAPCKGSAMGRTADGIRASSAVLPLLKTWLACYMGQITSQIVAIPVPPHNWVPKGKLEVPWLDLPIDLNLQRTNLRLGIISLFHRHRCEIWPSMQIIEQLPLVWIEPEAGSCLHSVSSMQVALNEMVTSLRY